MSEAEERRARLLRVYADVLGSANGVLVRADLRRVYHDRLSATVEAEVAELPHPFRAYYVEGQRSVVMAIEEILAAVERGEA